MAGFVNNVSVVDVMNAVYNGIPEVDEAAPTPPFPVEALAGVGGTIAAVLSVALVFLALVKSGLVEANRLLATVERLRGRIRGRNVDANAPPTPPPRNVTDDERLQVQMRCLAIESQEAHLYSPVARVEWI